MWLSLDANHCNEVQQGTYIGTLTVSFYVEGIDKKIKEHIPVIYAEAKTNEKYIIKFKI